MKVSSKDRLQIDKDGHTYKSEIIIYIFIYRERARRRVLWNSRKIWNTEVAVLISAAIS